MLVRHGALRTVHVHPMFSRPINATLHANPISASSLDAMPYYPHGMDGPIRYQLACLPNSPPQCYTAAAVEHEPDTTLLPLSSTSPMAHHGLWSQPWRAVIATATKCLG
jgi:hypothetical protein